VILFLSLALPQATAAGAWSTTGSLYTTHSGHSATLLPGTGKVLIAGGWEYISDYHHQFHEIYDPATGTWEPGQISSLVIIQSPGILFGNSMLFAGGYDGFNFLAAIRHYNGIGWGLIGSLITPRMDHTVTLMANNFILVAGGCTTGVNLFSGAELFDLQQNIGWTTAPMASARRFHSATLLPNGLVLVAGGDSTGKSAELYDYANQKWISTGTMVNARSGHKATLLPNGKVLVGRESEAHPDFSSRRAEK
jgi:hypothetical protein